MKIKYSIMSSNSNPLYLDFWPIVSRIWLKKFNITPILYYIDENHDIEIDETYGIVKRLKPVETIPTYLQCLWVRYWCFSEYPNDVCIISDIDMFPLSQKYFIDSISGIKDKYVHLNPCIDSYGTLPSCYHVSKGSLFSEILELDNSFDVSVKKLNGLNIGDNPGGLLKGNNQWFSDERFSSKKILNYKKENPNSILFLPRERGQNGRRVDRSNWQYDPRKLSEGYYYDSHSIRPYSRYKTEIDGMLNHIS